MKSEESIVAKKVCGMKRSRKWIAVAVMCICAAGGLVVWWWLMPARMCLDFRKVDSLTRLDEFKRSYLGHDGLLWVADSSYEEPRRPGTLGERGLSQEQMGVRQDGSGYYIFTGGKFSVRDGQTKVYAFDAESRLVAEANSIFLGLAPKDELERLVGVSNDKCWISVNRYIQMDGKWRKIARDTLLEVSLDDGHLKGIVHNVGDFESVVVDGVNRKAYLYRGLAHLTVDVYSADEAKVTESYSLRGYAGSGCIDYLAGEGVVLSDVSYVNERPTPIVVLRPDGTGVQVGLGMNAWWGGDGYVYYAEKTTRIWRCKPGEEPEPVFLGTSVLRGSHLVPEDIIYPATDHSFICFEYMLQPWYGGNEWHMTTVLLDLKTKEYMVR
jgi:hypothetical protein